MRQALVTLSTDGLRDYVTLSNGQKLILGIVTVLKFVTKLNVHPRLTRTILDAFNEHGEVMVTVDLDQMYELLAPVRAKWAKDMPVTSFMHGSDRTLQGKILMDAKTLETRLAAVEALVSDISKDRFNVLPKFDQLRQLTANLSVPATDVPVAAVVPATTPSVETLEANATLADEILFKVEATGEKVERLVQAGRKFNASAARSDLFSIAHRVAEIVNNVDLAQSWVEADLTKLAAEANRIHGLFEPAKV